MMVYRIEFYAHLPKTYIFFFFLFRIKSDPELDPDVFFQLSRIRGKIYGILIPVRNVRIYANLFHRKICNSYTRKDILGP